MPLLQNHPSHFSESTVTNPFTVLDKFVRIFVIDQFQSCLHAAFAIRGVAFHLLNEGQMEMRHRAVAIDVQCATVRRLGAIQVPSLFGKARLQEMRFDHQRIVGQTAVQHLPRSGNGGTCKQLLSQPKTRLCALLLVDDSFDRAFRVVKLVCGEQLLNSLYV